MVPLKARAGVIAAFGQPEIVEGKLIRVAMPDGKVLTGAQWEARHMTIVHGLPGLPPTKRLYVNRFIADPLREALAACVALGDGYRVRTLGCFAPRASRGNPRLFSLHSFGLAVDINADTNPMRSPMVRDIPDEWVAEFEARGWTWGGRWTVADPMHLQAATVR